jgi:hypothetical protein
LAYCNLSGGKNTRQECEFFKMTSHSLAIILQYQLSRGVTFNDLAALCPLNAQRQIMVLVSHGASLELTLPFRSSHKLCIAIDVPSTMRVCSCACILSFNSSRVSGVLHLIFRITIGVPASTSDVTSGSLCQSHRAPASLCDSHHMHALWHPPHHSDLAVRMEIDNGDLVLCYWIWEIWRQNVHPSGTHN